MFLINYKKTDKNIYIIMVTIYTCTPDYVCHIYEYFMDVSCFQSKHVKYLMYCCCFYSVRLHTTDPI